MPNETIEHNGAAVSTTAPAPGSTEAFVDHDAAAPQAGGDSKPVSNQRITRRKKLMIGSPAVLGHQCHRAGRHRRWPYLAPSAEDAMREISERIGFIPRAAAG
jgi:hypothetical protein